MAKVIPQDVFSVPFNKQFIMFLDYFYSFEVSRYEIKHCQLKAPVAYRVPKYRDQNPPGSLQAQQ